MTRYIKKRGKLVQDYFVTELTVRQTGLLKLEKVFWEKDCSLEIRERSVCVTI